MGVSGCNLVLSVDYVDNSQCNCIIDIGSQRWRVLGCRVARIIIDGSWSNKGRKVDIVRG